jgi:putative acyl-CoA dehydrogenase
MQARNPAVLEAMECLGGNGYVEKAMLGRFYREAPANDIWDGSANVIYLDVLHAVSRDPHSRHAVLDY